MKQKTLIYLLLFFLSSFLISCGGSESESNEATTDEKPQSMLSSAPKTLEEAEKDWQSNIGIGPIASFELPTEIDQELADSGKLVYEAKCTACHKPDKQFIGPAPKDILARRTPAWVMNMIMNPEEMIQKDPIARQLLIKFNGAPMANQSLTEAEARSVLEYFRTL
jgi:cytochrome c